VKIVNQIGSGEFGRVLKAEAKKLLPGQKKTMVVVKQLKSGATEEEKQDFLRPVEAMK
jgi:serine/threonine protein kinase